MAFLPTVVASRALIGSFFFAKLLTTNYTRFGVRFMTCECDWGLCKHKGRYCRPSSYRFICNVNYLVFKYVPSAIHVGRPGFWMYPLNSGWLVHNAFLIGVAASGEFGELRILGVNSRITSALELLWASSRDSGTDGTLSQCVRLRPIPPTGAPSHPPRPSSQRGHPPSSPLASPPSRPIPTPSSPHTSSSSHSPTY